MGEDAEDTKSWDTKELASWAMSRFHVSLSQAQMRNSTPDEVEEKLRIAAVEQINNRAVDGLMKYLEPNYAEQELSNWAKEKFGIDIAPKEMLLDVKGHERKPSDEIASLIETRARTAYARREIDYPVEHALTYAYGGGDGSTDNPYAAEFVRDWVHSKFGQTLTNEQIIGVPLQRLRDTLTSYQEEFLTGGKLEKTVDAIIGAHPNADELRTAFNERFQRQADGQGFPDH